jgi:primosomal protein N''
MEMFGKTLCVTFEELVGGGIMSLANYKKHVREKKFHFVQHGGNGRKALIMYECLPDKLRKQLDEREPKARERFIKQQSFPMNIRLKSDDKAVEFYKTYIPKISIERQKEYVLNAKVMNAMMAQETGLRNKHSEHGYTHKRLVRNTVISLCEELRRSFNHTLPKSESRLMEKFEDYKKRSYVALVSGTTGNQSARKIGPREGRILLRLRRSKFPVYTDMQIFDEFNRIVTERNARATREEDKLKPVESPQTVINYLYKTGIKLWWYGVVHGEIAFKNEFMPQFDTKLPQMPNTLWYGDGTKLNLYYKDYDKKNKRMVARTIDVYEVMDACSEVFLGYSFGAENFLTQYEAYRMALETWKIKPYEIVTDNQGGHKRPEAQAFFKKICHLHKTTMPHNGQSKTIESAFGRFQQQVMHKLYNYTGQNVTATKESSHVNIDLIMKNISQLPTLEEMKDQYLECRREWNGMPHPTSETGMTRMEMYTTLNSPKAEQLDEYGVQELFKLLSKDSVKYGKQGFVFSRNNKEYRYMVYDESGQVDMGFHMQNVGVSFRYKYDPMDMTSVELWEVCAGGRLKYAATATPKVVFHRATAERSTEESERLYAQIRAQKRALAGHYIASEDLLLEESMGEAYTKLVMPLPVGESQKNMERQRKQYANGELKAPVPYPEGVGPGTYEPEPGEVSAGIASPGEYTKQVSGMTEAEMYLSFLNDN